MDLELQTAEAIKASDLDKLRARGAALIISYHDFRRPRIWTVSSNVSGPTSRNSSRSCAQPSRSPTTW